MADEALYRIAPGFKVDEDESWMVYLSLEKNIALRTGREEFIKLTDARSTFRSRWLQENRPDPNTSAEFQAKWKKFNEKRLKKAEKLLKMVESYKKEALAIRDEQVATKRPRFMVDVDEISDYEEDLELVDDDYLPTCLPYHQQQEAEPTPIEQDTPPPATKAPINPLTDVPYFEESTFLKGVCETDAEILTALKPLVMKYNCRDRVLRVLRSYRSREKTAAALTQYENFVSVYKTNSRD